MLKNNKNILKKVLFYLFGGIIAVAFATILAANPLDIVFLIALLTLCLVIHKRPELGLYIIIFLPVIGELYRLPFRGDAGMLISDVIIPLYLLIWVARYIFSSKTSVKTLLKKVSKSKFILPIIIFTVIAGFSLLQALTLFPTNEVLVSSFYLFRLLTYIALYIVVADIITTEKKSQTIFRLLLMSAILLAIAGFIQLQIFPDLTQLEELGWDPHINRLVSTWLDPNFLGGLFAFIISVTLGVFLYTKNTRVKAILSLAIIILTTALFLTYSRSAYLALIAGIFIVSILKSRKLVVIGLIVLLLGVTFSERAQQRVGELVESVNSVFLETADTPDPTAKLRLKSWRQTVELIKEKPLIGHGYNTLKFVNYKKGFYPSIDHHAASGSDSSLLTIFATTGILGLAAFLWIIFAIIRQAIISWRNKKLPQFSQGFALGVLGGMSALLIHSIFINSLLFPQILITLWISIGLLESTSGTD